MGEIVFLAFLTALGFFIVMSKIGIGKFIKMGWTADLLLSFIVGFIFVGTFTGMAIGITAGIFISLFLWLARLFAAPKK